jgi:NAD(P)-dependent dehydrogenase (short-subunit alcohol dehydrogenase family)
VVADVDEAGGTESVQQIKDAGGEARFVRCDVSSDSEVRAMVATAIDVFGGLDYAFNNAGLLGQRGTTVECTDENWTRILDVNLRGVWLCMKYEIPEMLRRGSGAIVNNSSIEGLRGLRGWPAYVASKHGVIGLTRTTALEYAAQGIRVNAVCPGTIPTPMNEPYMRAREAAGLPGPEIAIGRTGGVDEVADAVLWLCEGATFVTGQAVVVDGGETIGR